MIDRRGFLGMLAAAAAGAALDPDKLLWVPGAKRIFIPIRPAILVLPPEFICSYTLKVLENGIDFVRLVNVRYNAEFPQKFVDVAPAQIGEIIEMRMMRAYLNKYKNAGGLKS